MRGARASDSPIAGVRRLAAAIERRYRAKGCSRSVFAELACEELGASRLEERFDFEAFLAWNLDAPALPRTVDRFPGERSAHLTLVETDRVGVDLHVYAPSITTIHDHDYDGAILGLEGTLVHGSYSFRDAVDVARGVKIGDLALERVDHIEPGDPRPLRAGPRTIHRVAHLANRTLLIVVRSRPARLQYEYFESGLALAAFASNDRTTPRGYHARANLVRVLGLGDEATAHRLLLSGIRRSDAWSTANDLLGSWEYLAATGELAPALRAARRRLGAWVDRLAPTHAAVGRRAAWKAIEDDGARRAAALAMFQHPPPGPSPVR